MHRGQDGHEGPPKERGPREAPHEDHQLVTAGPPPVADVEESKPDAPHALAGHADGPGLLVEDEA
eukprot:5077981-Pyramimonas_sp.AAC.1